MAYEDPQIVQEWLDALIELDVRVKKMFGCYCLYCDNKAVGWITYQTISRGLVRMTKSKNWSFRLIMSKQIGFRRQFRILPI